MIAEKEIIFKNPGINRKRLQYVEAKLFFGSPGCFQKEDIGVFKLPNRLTRYRTIEF